jgi:ribosomal protein S18 acetylase RimI-like enzyme
MASLKDEEIMATVLGDRAAPANRTPVSVRAIQPQDVEACGRVAYAAHSTVAAAHNVPCEHPSVDFSIGLIGNKIKDANAAGFVAERGGQILGSIFLNTFPPTPVAAIGPLTVDPAAEGSGAGSRLMQAVLDEARARKFERVRLVQSPSHLRSLALYAKFDFDVREPLILISGKPTAEKIEGHTVREATTDDVPKCDRLCAAVHGFARNTELAAAIAQHTALVVERAGRITGYLTGLGLRGYAVAETTDDLKALISVAPAIMGPGFFVPARNGDLVRWLFGRGFRARWPASLMTKGPYQEPIGAFLPSIAF